MSGGSVTGCHHYLGGKSSQSQQLGTEGDKRELRGHAQGSNSGMDHCRGSIPQLKHHTFPDVDARTGGVLRDAHQVCRLAPCGRWFNHLANTVGFFQQHR